MKPHPQQPATGDTTGANTGIGNTPAPDAGDAPHPSHQEGCYHDERVRLPAEGGAALLREVLAERASRGWKLISAMKRPEADELLVTWDTQGSCPS
jgi:hypothetical protein